MKNDSQAKLSKIQHIYITTHKKPDRSYSDITPTPKDYLVTSNLHDLHDNTANEKL